MLLRPTQNGWSPFGHGRGEQFDVVDVAGQDRFRPSYGHHDEMGVDDVARTCLRQEASDVGSVVEGHDDHRPEQSGEGLIAPDG